MDKSVIIKKLLVLFIPVLAGMPLSAQEQTDTVYMFRFVPQKDMFYTPFGDNQDELLRLSECVKQHKPTDPGRKNTLICRRLLQFLRQPD